MAKWAWFFAIVPVLGFVLFVVAAVVPEYGWDLPQNVSTFGKEIDFLYYMILWITGITYIGTQAGLVWIVYYYGKDPNRKATYTHGNRNLEVLWTVIPSIILLFIAVVQIPTWMAIRFPAHQPKIPPLARVVGRQFEWRIVYPGPDGKLDTVDDLHVANELHIPKEHRILVEIRTMDVLHSFFLPFMRVKQDLVPGLNIPVWFDALKSTREFQSEGAGYRDADLLRPGHLAVRLLTDERPIVKYLRGKLAPTTKQQLEAYQAIWKKDLDADEVHYAPALSRSLKAGLLADFNKIIKEEVLNAPDRLEGVKLTADTKDHLAVPAAGIRQNLLNRQLIDDAFPEDIQTLQRQFDLVCAELCGWGHYKMKGRLVVHDSREEWTAWLQKKYAEQEAAR